MQFHEFVNLLEAKGLKPRQRQSGQWIAHCPAHSDERPSLSVTENEGRILLHCFANCSIDQICASLGISVADLFDRENEDGNGQKAERIVAVYDYRDANGRLLFQTVRFEPKRFAYRQPDNNNGWRWTLEGVPRPLPLYRLPELLQADPQKPVFVVEGEKDVDSLRQHGLVATTNPMGAGKWAQVDDSPLEGRHVVILPDNDEVGRKHAEQIAQSLYGRAASVRIVYLPDLPPKGDVSDWLEAGHTVSELLELVSQTPEWQPLKPPEDAPQNGSTPPTSSQQTQCPFCQLSDADLLDLAQPVLDASNPVTEAAKRLCDAANIVAEDENAQLLLLIATTRVLPNPVHALVVGTTGAGKSALVNAISAAIPLCHRRTIIGTSARALLVHPLKPATLLNWLELPNLDSESVASTILRALLWQDGSDSVDYLLTEWVGGRARARTLKLPRQIALLSTRTDLPRDEQLVTRLFVVEIKETPEKRQSVLSAIARQWQDTERPDPDTLRQPVVAFMEWAQRRHWQVFIPFADALMALMGKLPPSERDYRDATNLPRLVAASAIWHFRQRQHTVTDEGVTVVADIADYALVRQLVAPAFAKTRTFALSEGERQIVDILQANGNPMTVKEIAQAANLSPTAVRCRLNRLKAKEIVIDEHSAERREKVWRLVASTTMITDLLPTPEQVLAHWRPNPDQPPSNSLNNLPQNDEGSSVHAFISVHDPRTLENAKRDWDFRECVHAFMDINQGQNQPHSDVADIDLTANVRENGERTNASQKTLSSISENERSRLLNACERMNASEPSTEPQKSETDLQIDLDNDLEVKVVCKNCGSWRRVPPDALMLSEPRCAICGSVMKPEPEGDNPDGGLPPDQPKAEPTDTLVDFAPTDQPLTEPTVTEPVETPANESDDRYIDTEAWIDQWWQEVLAQGDQPAVVDLETGEWTPVAFPNLPAKEAKCPRCGHEESVDPTVLLPPFCPACGNPMEWSSAPDPPTNSLLDAIKRLSALSSQLAADSETGGGRS